MKKTLVVLLFTVFYGAAIAQISVPKINSGSAAAALGNFVKPPAIGDIGGTTSGIVSALTTKLGLPATLKPAITEAISGFLTSKKSFAGLANSSPADYLAKFNPLQKGLFGKLKGIIGAEAFTKMLGLKPSGSNMAGDVLSHLFF